MSNDTTKKKPQYIFLYLNTWNDMQLWMNEQAGNGYKLHTLAMSGTPTVMELTETPKPEPIAETRNSDELLNACKYAQNTMSREYVTYDMHKTTMDALSIAIINEEGRRNK